MTSTIFFFFSRAKSTDFSCHLVQGVLSRGDFGVLGPEGDCWPQMACMVPSANDEVLDKWFRDFECNSYSYNLVFLMLSIFW